MAIVIGILLLGLGAVLVWGVDRSVSGVDLSTIGVILMTLGGVGILASLLASARATSGRAATGGRAWESLAPVAERQPEDAARRSEPHPPPRSW